MKRADDIEKLVDLESERCAISAVFEEPPSFAHLRTLLLADDFYLSEHCMIWTVFGQMVSEEPPIWPSPIATRNYLSDRGLLDQVGGKQYIEELATHLRALAARQSISTREAPLWAKRISDFADRRMLLTLSGEVHEMAYALEREPNDIWAEVVQKVADGRKLRNDEKGFLPMSADIDEVKERVSALLRGEKPNMVPTGLSNLDFFLGGGLPRGDLTILAGRPGMLKTTLALQILRGAEVAGFRGAFTSIEARRPELIEKELSARAGISLLDLRRGKLGKNHDDLEGQEAFLHAVLDEMANASMVIQDSPVVSLTEMHYHLVLQSLVGGVDLHVIDYVELIQDVVEDDNGQVLGVAAALKRAKAIAKSLNVAVVVLSQLNRGVEKVPSRRPLLHHLMWAGEPVASVVLMTYWPWKYWVRGDRKIMLPGDVETEYDREADRMAPVPEWMAVCIAKARYGTEAVVPLRVNPATGVFTPWEEPGGSDLQSF